MLILVDIPFNLCRLVFTLRGETYYETRGKIDRAVRY